MTRLLVAAAIVTTGITLGYRAGRHVQAWVTDVPDLSRNAQLKALGNGVVPQQAEAALRTMIATELAA